MATTATPEIEHLADELRKRFGDRAFTARDLAVELVATDGPVELIAAFDDALSRAAAADEVDELDETVWGAPPTDERVAEARQLAHEALDQALGRALNGALTRDEAARRLGISPQAVSKRLAAGRLVSLRRGRTRRLPAWQFHDADALSGLAELIDVFPGSALALTNWATTPAPDLDGATPAEVMARRGGVERVLAAARSLTADAW